MNIKKTVSAILAAAMVLCLCILPSSALGGKWQGLTWSITDGTLTVTGGSIPDSTASAAAPWSLFASSVTRVVLDKSVTRIGERAFEDMTKLTDIDFGGATAIGRMAFSGCTNLTALTLPDSVTEIGGFAFAECTALKSITLPKKLTSLGEGAFESCQSLSSIAGGSDSYPVRDGVLYSGTAVIKYPPAKKGAYTAPAGITEIAPGAFRDSTALTEASLPEITKIGDGAFYGCTALANITMPKVTVIGRAAFYGCALRSAELPASLTVIGGSAFAYCESLARLDFAGDAPTAGDDILYGCDASLTVTVTASAKGFGGTWQNAPVIRHGIFGGEADGIRWSLDSATGILTVTGNGPIPDYDSPADAPWYPYRKVIRSVTLEGITAVGTNAFRYSTVESLTLPDSVKSIGAWAFSGCTSLTYADLGSTATVGECAFFGCTALTRVMAGSVTEFERQAFSSCDSLLYVFTGTTAPTLGEYAFDLTGAAILYPYGSTYPVYPDVYAEPYTPGDANGDGSCNISDVSLMLKYIAGWDVTMNRVSADANADTKVNVTDASLLLKYIAAWDVTIGIPGRSGSPDRQGSALVHLKLDTTPRPLRKPSP